MALTMTITQVGFPLQRWGFPCRGGFPLQRWGPPAEVGVPPAGGRAGSRMLGVRGGFSTSLWTGRRDRGAGLWSPGAQRGPRGPSPGMGTSEPRPENWFCQHLDKHGHGILLRLQVRAPRRTPRPEPAGGAHGKTCEERGAAAARTRADSAAVSERSGSERSAWGSGVGPPSYVIKLLSLYLDNRSIIESIGILIF